jgi:hypothetical protein
MSSPRGESTPYSRLTAGYRNLRELAIQFSKTERNVATSVAFAVPRFQPRGPKLLFASTFGVKRAVSDPPTTDSAMLLRSSSPELPVEGRGFYRRRTVRVKDFFDSLSEERLSAFLRRGAASTASGPSRSTPSLTRSPPRCAAFPEATLAESFGGARLLPLPARPGQPLR